MKNISILVWNDFTHDKRVTNISKTFWDDGNNVTVIAAKPYRGLQVLEEKGFHIKRVPQFSSLYSKQKNLASETKLKNKMHKKSVFRFLKNNTFRIYITSFLNWFSFNFGLLLAGINSKPDIVYANDLDTLTVGYIISKICRAKLIFDSHEIWFFGSKYLNSSKFRQLMWRILQKILIRKPNAVIVTTETRAEYLKMQYNLEKVHVIRNCSRYEEVKPSNLFRDEFNISKDTPILIYHGSINEIRGIYTIVDAVKTLDNIAVVFMGLGSDLINLKEYIKKNNLDDRIFVKDAVKPEEVLNYIASADIGIQLFHYTFNHYTVISNKLLECIMAGLAVIANNYPEMKKIVVNEDLGKVVDYRKMNDIKDAISQVISKKNLEKYKSNAKKVRKKYSWEVDEYKLLELVK
ncbi:MAG: glycosyltransferase family 4 protein [Candidatus Tenebribacter davisii]|nr:glycosyltransferase family 4 protein [Candidatus Tenebribacter davisii]